MAREADGSLVFDTELDNDGFEKGSGKLLNAIEDLTNAVDNMGENMMRSFGRIVPVLQTVADAAVSINERLGASAAQTAEAGERVVDTESRVAQAAQEAVEVMDAQGTAAGSFSGAVNASQTSVSALEREVNSLSSGLRSVAQSAEAGFANGRAVLAFDSKITNLEERLGNARQRLKEFGDVQIPTEAFQELTVEISRAERALFRLYAQRETMQELGVSEHSRQWKRLAVQIEKAEEVLARYEREQTDLAAHGGAFIQGSDTAEFSRMEASLKNAGEVLAQNKALIDQEALSQARLNVLAAQEAAAAAATARERAEAIEQLRTAQQELNSLAQSMSSNARQDVGTPDENRISLWQRFGAAIREAGAGALKVTATLVKVPFQAMQRGITSFANGVRSFTKKAKGAKLQANALAKTLMSVKNLLISRIKQTFISAVFNGARDALKSLAQFSNSFNTAMSNIQNAAKSFSGNLAVSIGGVAEVLEPMLTSLINALSTAVTYINAFFAALSGKSTVTVAKKQADSYRDSLDDAAESAEELKNQVYGFDELTIQNDDTKGGGSGGAVDLFEEAEIGSIIPEDMLNFFNELKELWEDSDFFNFGKKLADGLNELLQAVDDWFNNVLRPKGTEWAAKIAAMLNGLVDGFDGKLLGKTIADGMNAIFDIVNTFLKEFNFENLGNKIGDTINGFFENVEWDLIGETFANGWNALVDTIFGIVNTVDWSLIGDSLATDVQSFLNTVDWDRTAQTISTAVNGITEAISHFINGIDWNSAGSDVGTAISTLFTGIDWAAALQTVVDGFAALEDLILGAVQGIQWGEVTRSLADGINSIDLTEAFANAGQTINSFFIGVLDAAIGFIETVDWSALTQKLWDGLVSVVESIDFVALVNKAFELLGATIGAVAGIAATLGENIWEVLHGAWESVKDYFSDYIQRFGGDIADGLFYGIYDAFVNVGTWIKENIFDPFINGFKKAFGIHSPSTAMAEMGKYLVEGLLKGIEDVWDGITQFFITAVDGVKSLLSNGWEAITTTASAAWEKIKSAVTKKFDEAKTTLSTAANNIKTTLSTTWSNLTSATTSSWNSLKSAAVNSFNDLKSSLTNTSNSIKSTIENAWRNLQTTTSNTWNNIKSAATGSFENLRSFLTTAASGIQSAVERTWSSLQTATSSAWNNLSNTVQGLWNNLRSALSSSDWSSIGSNLVSGIQRGVSSMWNTLSSTVSNLASGLTNTIRNVFEIHSPSAAWARIGEYLDMGLQEGLENEKRSVLSTASNLAQSVNDEIGGEEATLQIGTEAGGLVDNLSGIAAQLSEIAVAFCQINAMLSRIGSLPVPSVALGTELPYKTRISSDTAGSGTGLPGDLSEKLAVYMELLEQILEAVRAGHIIMVDRAVLGRTTQASLNDITRKTGKFALDF